MATTWRGRSSSSSRPTYGGYSSFLGESAFNRWGKQSSASRRSFAGKAKKASTQWAAPAAYKGVSKCFVCKINSYKTLFNQTQGAAKFSRPTPAILNNFARWVEKGAIVQTVAPSQIARWARNHDLQFNSRNPSVPSCKSVLTRKFGKSTIKAVARAKNGYFLVATSSTFQGRPFSFPR